MHFKQPFCWRSNVSNDVIIFVYVEGLKTGLAVGGLVS